MHLQLNVYVPFLYSTSAGPLNLMSSLQNGPVGTLTTTDDFVVRLTPWAVADSEQLTRPHVSAALREQEATPPAAP